jgi:hypothetical protein
MAREAEEVRLTQSSIPRLLDFDVKESSFFREWNRLLSPTEVQAKAESQQLAGVNLR